MTSLGLPEWGILLAICAVNVVVIAGLALAAVLLWRATGAGRNAPSTPAARALDILKERYARGEIARDEYEQMKKDLQS